MDATRLLDTRSYGENAVKRSKPHNSMDATRLLDTRSYGENVMKLQIPHNSRSVTVRAK